MKILNNSEIDQVSGAGLFGSALYKFSTIVKNPLIGTFALTLNSIENKFIASTIARIPFIGSTLANLLKDPFGAFPK